ncbi:hypothetical protein GA0061100_11080 [Rhizobium hainanense]|uniref:Uncharacterized protein n=1 Tax=Rhizobium hainanense TaxID=52131 RepID=A0A1C3W1Y8_9HYPH|nr:hypothetical protein GA0061100_11080 [Rhizobium hainanense]
MPNVLILTTYPLVNPRHGGQVRAQNICSQFQAAGWRVLNIAVFEEDSYLEVAPWDVPFPANSPHREFRGKNVMFIGDLQTSKFVRDETNQALILSRIPADLDVVHVEQPWLWPVAAAYRQQVNSKVLLSYGSQNIEHELKRSILNSLAGSSYKDIIEDIINEIMLLEQSATRGADVVMCVSSSDELVHRKWGARQVVVAPNGVEYRSPDRERLEYWRLKFGATKFLIYVGSAHPPNFTHFNDIVGGSLACFPPDAKLVIVGSVSEHIYRECLKGSFSSVNMSRLELLFELSNADLDAVKAIAHGYFLPIPFGGGTNLKTAEALISEKFIVGTRSAFRGFERYIDSPGVHVFESPAEMHKLVQHVFAQDPRKVKNLDSLKPLTWESCIQPMLAAISGRIGAGR